MLMFKKSVLSLAAIALASCLAMPASAQTRTLKMQSTWPASLTLQDNFKMFAERVDKLTAGAIQIERIAAGQIVPPFEILDATHKKVIDGGDGVAYYGSARTNRHAVLGHACGPFGMTTWTSSAGCTRRRMDLYWEFYRDILKLDIVAFPIGARVRRRSAGQSGQSRTSPTSKA